MTAPTVTACYFCKESRPVATTDYLDRPFCEDCATYLPASPEARAMAVIIETTPFEPGDVVEAWLVGEIYHGVGEIDDISVMIEHGGTPVRPSFHVTFSDKAEGAPDDGWYNEHCLVRTNN